MLLNLHHPSRVTQIWKQLGDLGHPKNCNWTGKVFTWLLRSPPHPITVGNQSARAASTYCAHRSGRSNLRGTGSSPWTCRRCRCAGTGSPSHSQTRTSPGDILLAGHGQKNRQTNNKIITDHTEKSSSVITCIEEIWHPYSNLQSQGEHLLWRHSTSAQLRCMYIPSRETFYIL